MLFKKGKKAKKCVFIGLDGVPYELLQRLMEQGHMPHLAALKDRGGFTAMKSSVPEVSSVAWSSFNTGFDPSHHGIFGFMELDKNYQMTFPTFLNLKQQTLWEKTALLDKQTVVVNIPQTYPVRPFKGQIISGFISLDVRKSVYPPSLLDLIKRFDYRIDVDIPEIRDKDTRDKLLMERIFSVFEARVKLVKHLLKKADWDLFLAVVTETDRLMHYFFPSLVGRDNWTEDCLRLFNAIDGFIADVQETADTDNLFVMSDHGFCVTEREVLINNLLRREGLLIPKPGAKAIQDIDFAQTKAFALDPARIYIHDERFSQGHRLTENQRQRLVDYIIDACSNLEYAGSPVFQHIFRREDIYSGPLLSQAADILLVTNKGFDAKGTLRREDIFCPPRFQGMHSYDNAFFLSSMPLDFAEDMNVQAPHWILFDLIKS